MTESVINADDIRQYWSTQDRVNHWVEEHNSAVFSSPNMPPSELDGEEGALSSYATLPRRQRNSDPTSFESAFSKQSLSTTFQVRKAFELGSTLITSFENRLSTFKAFLEAPIITSF
ncbi:hypothetical protein V5O48_004896 [Marasmius crinis-equi]|uniref:Uncharacterized protein n=1 Tax=Marasmius crinis-equi TaxID=585013 RepID=A0ABR3FPC1_9AGAR